MKKTYEVEINGRVYEIQADSPEDAAQKAQAVAPHLQGQAQGQEQQQAGRTPFQYIAGGVNEALDARANTYAKDMNLTPGGPVEKALRFTSNAVMVPLDVVGGAATGLAKAAYQDFFPKGAKQALGQIVQTLAPRIVSEYQKSDLPVNVAAARQQWSNLTPRARANLGAGVNLGMAAAGVPGAASIIRPGVAAVRSTVMASPKVVGGAARVADKTLGAVAEHLSDVPADALRAYGWGTGETAKNIKKYAGKQHEVGQEILEHLDKIDDHLPEKKVVNQALSDMPPVNIGNTVNALLKSKERLAGTPSAVSGNQKIDEMVEVLINAADKNGNIPAADFRAIRMQFDNDVAAAFNKDYKSAVESAGIAARNQMMDDLLTTAEKTGNKEYADAMRSYSEKLQSVDKLKGYIGSSSDVRARKIDSFVNNIFGANKADAQAALEGLGGVVGSDLLQKARYVAMAKQIGTATGAPSLLSPVKTGSTMKGLSTAGAAAFGASTGNVPMALGGLGGFALASPAVAARILGPLSRVAERLAPQARAVGGVVPASRPTWPRLPLSDMNREKLQRLAGGEAASPDAFAGMGDLLTPKEYKAKQALDRMAAEQADPDLYQTYNPDELLDYDTYSMRRAEEEATAGPSYHRGPSAARVRADALADLKRNLGFGPAKEIPSLSKLPEARAKTIRELAEKINTDPVVWNQYYDRGILDQPWNPQWSDGENLAAIHPDDLIQWMNETGTKKQNRLFGNERGAVGAVPENP